MSAGMLLILWAWMWPAYGFEVPNELLHDGCAELAPVEIKKCERSGCFVQLPGFTPNYADGVRYMPIGVPSEFEPWCTSIDMVIRCSGFPDEPPPTGPMRHIYIPCDDEGRDGS